MSRTHNRVTYLIETELESSSGRRQARVSDISLGGCFVDSIVSVSVGESMTCTIPAPDGEKLQVDGRVAYTMPGCGFGLNFIGLGEEDIRILGRIIASHG